MDNDNNTPTPDESGKTGENSEQTEKTFTQDQVNDIVSKRLSEANQKADKRVKDEVAKALAEAERQSKLTESEREKEFKAKQQAELDKRDRIITLRERRADAKDVLSDKGIDSSLVDFVIDVDEALLEGLTSNNEFFTLLLKNNDLKKRVLDVFKHSVYEQLKKDK